MYFIYLRIAHLLNFNDLHRKSTTKNHDSVAKKYKSETNHFNEQSK